MEFLSCFLTPNRETSFMSTGVFTPSSSQHSVLELRVTHQHSVHATVFYSWYIQAERIQKIPFPFLQLVHKITTYNYQNILRLTDPNANFINSNDEVYVILIMSVRVIGLEYVLEILVVKMKFKYFDLYEKTSERWDVINKSAAYSSQGSQTGQLDFCNWLADGSTTG